MCMRNWLVSRSKETKDEIDTNEFLDLFLDIQGHYLSLTKKLYHEYTNNKWLNQTIWWPWGLQYDYYVREKG